MQRQPIVPARSQTLSSHHTTRENNFGALPEINLVPNLFSGKNTMLVGCGYKDDLCTDSTNVLVANSANILVASSLCYLYLIPNLFEE